MKRNSRVLEDRVGRSFGVLTHARIITTNEAMEHLSSLRLGLSLGLLSKVSVRTLNELMIAIQPAHIALLKAQRVDVTTRDSLRADLVRERLRAGMRRKSQEN